MPESIILAVLDAAQHEVMLFAAAGLILGGIDDLAIDMIYLARLVWKRLFIYTRHERMTAATLPVAVSADTLAVFIPAWQEADVIGHMLRNASRKWMNENYRIFVGVYPNDKATLEAVLREAAKNPKIIIVTHEVDGPTTKADCLNAVWRAANEHQSRTAIRFKGIVMHDAEDVVHGDELRLLSVMVERFDLVQLPVLPLVNQQSRWIAGHYCDEFAEAHGKSLCVREAVGASVPSAGVGCAISWSALEKLAALKGGAPFDPQSLTEDYELGLSVAETGGRGVFIRMTGTDGSLICTREYFPETISTAVRQKSRWMTGIALSGWDRMGWKGGLNEKWMRLHDRRAMLAALILCAAYLAMLLYGVNLVVALIADRAMSVLPPLLRQLLLITACLMAWRMIIRAAFVGQAYGWQQALWSIPRTFIANVIALMAARRAMTIYLRTLRGAKPIWDKTEHRFPSSDAEANIA